VRLLARDDERHVLLLERCRPGTHLRERALEVLVDLLPRLWKPAGPPFTSLADEAAWWVSTIRVEWERAGKPFEEALVDAAISILEELAATQAEQVLVHQDLHPDNVLAAEREPWLVIDPKPYVGDPAYDPVQHLLNCPGRLRADPHGMVARMADLCEVDRDRLRLWVFARCVIEWLWFDVDGVVESLAP